MDLDKQEICIRSDIIKRFINRSVEKERYLFLAMCSDQDADRVLGKLKMETKDFERLSFLITQLGFYSLGMSFDIEHQDLLENIGTAIETDIGHGCVDVEEEQKKIHSWKRQFLDQLPTEKMKENIRRVFEQG